MACCHTQRKVVAKDTAVDSVRIEKTEQRTESVAVAASKDTIAKAFTIDSLMRCFQADSVRIDGSVAVVYNPRTTTRTRGLNRTTARASLSRTYDWQKDTVMSGLMQKANVKEQVKEEQVKMPGISAFWYEMLGIVAFGAVVAWGIRVYYTYHKKHDKLK